MRNTSIILVIRTSEEENIFTFSCHVLLYFPIIDEITTGRIYMNSVCFISIINYTNNIFELILSILILEMILISIHSNCTQCFDYLIPYQSEGYCVFDIIIRYNCISSQAYLCIILINGKKNVYGKINVNISWFFFYTHFTTVHPFPLFYY